MVKYLLTLGIPLAKMVTWAGPGRKPFTWGEVKLVSDQPRWGSTGRKATCSLSNRRNCTIDILIASLAAIIQVKRVARVKAISELSASQLLFHDHPENAQPVTLAPPRLPGPMPSAKERGKVGGARPIIWLKS